MLPRVCVHWCHTVSTDCGGAHPCLCEQHLLPTVQACPPRLGALRHRLLDFSPLQQSLRIQASDVSVREDACSGLTPTLVCSIASRS